MVEQKFEMDVVRCKICGAKYYIKWIWWELSNTTEYCANCGDSENLNIIKTIKVKEVKI